jgi:hypothetical protein
MGARKPVPAGFAEYAAEHAVMAIAAHFGMCNNRTVRLLREMPADWRDVRTAKMKARQSAGGKRNCYKMRAAYVPKPKKPPAPRKIKAVSPLSPLPDGFLENAMAMSDVALADHYGSSATTVSRMIAKLEPEQQAAVRAAAAERRITGSRASALKQAREARAAVRAEQRAAAKAERAAAAKRLKPRRNAPVNWGFHKPTETAPALGGDIHMAAQFLRRRCGQVYNERKAITGHSWGDIWIVDNRRLTTEAMLERARGEGWDADGWRAIAE